MKVSVATLLRVSKNMTTDDIIERWENADDQIKAQLKAFAENIEQLKFLKQQLALAIALFNQAKAILDAAKAALGIGDVPIDGVSLSAKAVNAATDLLITTMENTYIEILE